MESRFTFWFILYMLIQISSQGLHRFENFEGKVFDELFYIRNIPATLRPVHNKSEAVDVSINIAYIQLVDLDDRNQILKSNVWIRQHWHNEFLTWNPNEFGGVEEIVVDKKWVWTPDLVLHNSADDSLNGQLDQYKTRVILRHDGKNSWYLPAILISACSIDIRYFPFDYQRCDITFGSWSYNSLQLNLKSSRDDIDLSFYQESTQFWLIKTKAVLNRNFYACCPDPFLDVTFTLFLHRQAGHYVFNVIVPSIVMTFFALFIFAYPEQTGERMGLAIQCFLTISILTMMVSDMLPIDSNVTPLLASFMMFCITAMTLSILMNTFCSNLNRRTPVPPWLKELVFKRLSPKMFINSCVKKVKARKLCNPFAICEGLFAANVRKELSDDNPEDEEYLNDAQENLFKKLLENASMYSKRSLEIEKKHHKSFKSHKKSQDYICLKKLTKLTLQQIAHIIRDNRTDAKNITLLSKRVLQQVEKENIANFWKRFAQTTDRFLLVTFSCVYFVSVVMLFMQIPKSNMKFS